MAILQGLSIDVNDLVWSSAAVLLAALIQTASGFGFAIIAVPLLLIVLPARTAVFLTVLLGIIQAVLGTWHERNDVDLKALSLLSAGAIAGIPFGGYILVLVGDALLRIVVGVLAITAGLVSTMELRGQGAVIFGPLRCGFAAGILCTSTGMAGLPAILYLASRDRSLGSARATSHAFLLFVNIGSAAVLGVLAASPERWAPMVAILVPALGIGVLLGGWLGKSVSLSTFRVAVVCLAVVAGSSAVLTGLMKLGHW